ncbi:MAG: 23S rRNA (guanosine(2251)-2'-O)-methyltransferase RlmB [bacterium]|nr:23S rRNA (guanosine(2251)-2'-O)-methyltransferase RlmB [bacterium]
MEDLEIIYGTHPVEEALNADRKFARILVRRSKESDRKISHIVTSAQVKDIKVKYVPEEELEEYAAGQNHQGIIAFLEPRTGSREYDLSKNLFIMIDHITDVHNLGAILRSAEFFGADGVILPKDRSAQVNDVAARTSAGAVNYLNIIGVSNLSNEIKKFKENNFWLVGADVNGDRNIYEFEFPKKTLLVVGNEEKGISRLITDQLDYKVSIPRSGHVESLNVSVAAALFLFHYQKMNR